MAYSGYQVTSQASGQVQVSQAGQVVTGVAVYFVTGNGNSDSVFVPDEHYNPDYVARMVRVRAEVVDTIGQLADELPPAIT